MALRLRVSRLSLSSLCFFFFTVKPGFFLCNAPSTSLSPVFLSFFLSQLPPTCTSLFLSPLFTYLIFISVYLCPHHPSYFFMFVTMGYVTLVSFILPQRVAALLIVQLVCFSFLPNTAASCCDFKV